MSASSSYASGILTTQFDYSKIFIWNRRSLVCVYTNSTGSTVNLTRGQLMGRIFSSNKVKPHVSTSTDGSQIPMGVMMANYTVPDGTTVNVTLAIAGDIAREAITFGGSDTYATVILLNNSSAAATTTQLGTIEDILIGRGLITVVSTENTIADN